ncbi:MAG: dephospho-CoA kinase [Verrucomicrobiales bacterium]|nr:dephospho-CoA kinase [Verrucomicrobiales bacterium]MCP5527599.1 dephospho-CoA kinase [Verrucomicrobiales bacterium]
MRLLGITGGVGMGKSAFAALLESLGVKVVDTDGLARELTQPGQPPVQEIRRELGERFVDPEGRLRRAELGDHVFTHPEARARLEAILHPRIRRVWGARVAEWRQDGERLGAVVIPLLFETGAASQFDEVICVACTAATQAERLVARGWSLSQSAQRIGAQLDIHAKLARADRVVWTEGDLSVTREQAVQIVEAPWRWV